MGKLNLKYGIITFGLVAVAAASTVPGCSAAGVTGGEEDSGALEDAPALVDVTVEDTGTKDAAADAKKDTGTDAKADAKDSSTDASDGGGGIVGPAPGSACTTPGTIYKQTCGFCGTQEAICEGTKIVSAYGLCTGEVVGGCTPGANRQTACGLCGTKTEICQNNCQWAAGGCGGEPMNACAPGAVKYTTAQCSLPDTFRRIICENTCTFGLPADLPCIPKDNFLTISGAVGASVNADFDLSPVNDQLPRLNTGNCPVTQNATSTSYKYVELRNTSALTAKVEVWFDKVAGGSNLDTIVTYYPGNVAPVGAARLTCTGSVNDSCFTAPCVNSSWGGLVGVNAVSIPPNSSVMVYHAMYGSGTGSFTMFAKTISLL